MLKLHRIPKIPSLNFSPLPHVFLQAFNASMSSYNFFQYIHQRKLTTMGMAPSHDFFFSSTSLHILFCTYCFPLQLLLLHHHHHKVVQWSRALKLCFTRTWEHEGSTLESFSYKIAFKDMAPARKKSFFSLPSSLKAPTLSSLTFQASWRRSIN